MPGVDAEEGRGLALARALLDTISLDRLDGINHWRLVRRLDGAAGGGDSQERV
jgi:hypothetical protein